MRSAVLALAVAAAFASAGSSATGGGSIGGTTLEQLVGQRLIVAMRGATPTASLLARIRAGQVGGVILFGGNVRNVPQVRALTESLRAAARAGGQPVPLIAVDQEGGPTRRFVWASPARPAALLGLLAPTTVRAAGRSTAAALRALGVNVDLAPVADVPGVPDSFIAAQARAYSSNPQRVATIATAFAGGLADGGVAATAKHFPGLGRALVSTDVAAVTLTAGRQELDADLVPFRQLIAAGVPIVMLSNATYTALDEKPAAWSAAVQALLRRTLGFAGVTITDALDAVARTHGRSVASAAVLAAQAGTDLLLVAGSESESNAVYRRLLRAAETGKLPRPPLERSYARILALKRAV
jgi:beta-N-acetylhexosaminidase